MVDEIHAMALTRVKNKEWLKGRKAGIVVCGRRPHLSTSKKVRCSECGRECYHSTNRKDFPDLLDKKHKLICGACALKNHSKNMNKEQIEILEKVWGKE